MIESISKSVNLARAIGLSMRMEGRLGGGAGDEDDALATFAELDTVLTSATAASDGKF